MAMPDASRHDTQYHRYENDKTAAWPGDRGRNARSPPTTCTMWADLRHVSTRRKRITLNTFLRQPSSGRRNDSCANALAVLAVRSSCVQVIQVQQVGNVKVSRTRLVKVEGVHGKVVDECAVGHAEFDHVCVFAEHVQGAVGAHVKVDKVGHGKVRGGSRGGGVLELAVLGHQVIQCHHCVVLVVALLLLLGDDVEGVSRKSDFHCREHISAECVGSDCFAKRGYPSSAWTWGGVATEFVAGEALDDDDRRDGGAAAVVDSALTEAES